MNAPKREGRYTKVKSPKRKAVSTPEPVNSSKRPGTRRSQATEENRPQEEIDRQEDTIDTPPEKSPQKTAKATSARATDVVHTQDVKVPLEQELVANSLDLAVNVSSNLSANSPAGSAENLRNLKNSQKRKGTKAVKAQEKTENPTSEEVSKTTKKRIKQEVQEEKEHHLDEVSTSKGRRKRKQQAEVKEEFELPLAHRNITKTTKRKRETEQEEVKEEEEDEAGEAGTPKKVKRKRKTKEEKEVEAMPLAARTTNLQMYIGAHVSSAKGSSWPSSCMVMRVLRGNRIYRGSKRGHQLRSYRVIYTSTPSYRFSGLTKAQW